MMNALPTTSFVAAGATPAAIPGSTAERVAWRLFVAGLVCEMTLSAPGLLAIGIPYDAPWGSYAAKLHPGTYLTLLAAAVALSGRGHPLAVAGAILRRQSWLAVYLGCMLFVFAYSLLHNGPSGAAFFIDTLIIPAVSVLTLDALDARRARQCVWWLLLPLTLNATISLGEALLRQRAIPLIVGGAEVIDVSFRPSALMGHPLNNALATATLLLLPLRLAIAPAWRAAWIGLLWVALLSFGGRTSFLVATAFYGALGVGRALLGAARGRYSYRQLVTGLLAVMLVPTLLAVGIATAGLGDRILQGLQWDSSAQVRARIWEIPGLLDDWGVLFGVSPREIENLSARIGLDADSEAVENFWLSLFLQLGLAGFLPFVVAMASAVRWMWRVSGAPTRLAVVVFFLAASGFNSLASKTVCLTLLFVAVAATARHEPRSTRSLAWSTPGRGGLR